MPEAPEEPKIPKYQPLRRYMKVSDQMEKAIIVAISADGLKQKEAAEKYGVPLRTVARIWGKFRKTVTPIMEQVARESRIEFAGRIVGKARDAIEGGLDAKEDPYKRAGVGIKVMEGIGEFQAPVQVGVALIGMTPVEMRARYIGIDTEEKETSHG